MKQGFVNGIRYYVRIFVTRMLYCVIYLQMYEVDHRSKLIKNFQKLDNLIINEMNICFEMNWFCILRT